MKARGALGDTNAQSNLKGEKKKNKQSLIYFTDLFQQRERY